MLPPDEITVEAIDEELLKVPIPDLFQLYTDEAKKFAANGIQYEGMMVLAPIDVYAQVMATQRILMEMGMITQERINQIILAFKVGHMRSVLEVALPQIRTAQARAAILQPGGIPPGGPISRGSH